MATYYLKYYAEILNFRGQLTRVEIHQRGVQPASVLQIGDVCGLVLELQGGQDDVFTPILKTQARLSMISSDDKPTAGGVKYGDWSEFYTPDSTLYKVIIKTKPNETAESWETRWTGYITPDSWQEGLEYRSSISITARDNIGHLQDFDFVENIPAGVDEYGLLSIRALINAAMELIDMPMELQTNVYPGDIVGDGASILDSMVSVQKFDGDDWYQVLEGVLDSIGYCLRYTDQNRVTLAPLRHLPLTGEETQGSPVVMEFYGGDGAVVPAVKKVVEEHAYNYEAEAGLAVNGEYSVGEYNPYTYKCYIGVKGTQQVARNPIYHESAPYAKLTDPGNTVWKAGADFWKPGPASALMKILEGDGWDNYIFLAANGLDGQRGESAGTDLRTQSFRFHCGTPDVTLRLYFNRTPVSVAHWGSSWDPQPPLDWDGVVPMAEPFFGAAGLSKIRYTIKMEHGSTVFWWGDGSWKNEETINEQEYDPISQTTDVEIPLAANTDIEDDVFITLNIVHIEYTLAGERVLDLYPGSDSTLIGCYARMSSATVEVNQANLAKNTVRTFNDEKYNVIIRRTPEVSPLSRDVKIAIPSSYKDALFYYPNGEDFPKPYPYRVNWDTVQANVTKPLPVLIHQQLLCYRGANLWELSGECAPKDHALFRFDHLVQYKQRTYLIQSGTIDFLSGTVSGALLREFLNYDDIWDDTQEGDWEDEGIYNSIGGGASGGGSGHSGSSGGGGSHGTAHTHENKELLDLLSSEYGYLLIGGDKVKAGEADHAADSDKWDGHDFDDYLDQPVRTTDDVQFKDVEAEDVSADNVEVSGKVTTTHVESPGFTTGPLGAGFRLFKPTGGNASLELDELTVRKTMRVFELIIQQIKHQGGMVIYSAASLVCSRVEELENGYKCYFDTMENEQGEAQVPNEFVVGDQARCQRFDLAATNAKYYWRLVTAVGEDYIVLSKTDCDSGSGVPAVGDNIVQLGHRTNTARQSAKVTTCIDSQSPRDDYYKGINSYDLTGKLITTIGVKDNEIGVWTKNGSFEGVVTIKGGSGLETLDEWAAVSQSITNAQLAANKALDAIADINSDTVLDPSEKNAIRTEWITINGTEKLDRVGARGSYSVTKALFERYHDIGGQFKYDYNGHIYTRANIIYTYSAVGVAALDAAYLALREYLAQVQLNIRTSSYEGFDRGRYSDLLTTYYDAELYVNDQINQALERHINDTKAEILSDLGDFETAVETSIEELQAIVDNTIETWFYDGEPTLNNLPASAWTTEELLARHLGDLYYDQSTGLAYRFQRSGSEGAYTYYWYCIPDSAVARALAAAAKAQDTADHKRRVFRAQPTNADAYDPGDIWLHATYPSDGSTYSDEMLVCNTAKAEGVAFSIAHWGTATKYTDDTVANQAVADAAAAQSDADQALLNAGAAQQTADNAAAAAAAANTRLDNWANDGKISPTEKTGLKQQQADIQAEYTEICVEATRYGVSTTAYASAYTAANTALTKYTAASPEVITVESDYANIAAYYSARNTILQAIAAAAKKVADDAQDAADAAQAAADAAQAAADAAQQAADAAQSAADAAQSKADSAYGIATAARDRLADWASDSYISPTEKTALKQQQTDIQTEYADIVADATRYNVSSTAYTAAYNAANTALTKYTAASPESISVGSDYNDIAAYYTARTTILAAIATAAKKVATDAQAAADKALEGLEEINSDSILDRSEKAAVREKWVSINGMESLNHVGMDGTYYAAKRMIQELKDTNMSTKLTYNGLVYTFDGEALTYGNYGEAQLDAAYMALREFLHHCQLFIDKPYYGFSRSEYSRLLRDYDTALVNVQRLYTDNAKQSAEEDSMDAIAKNLGYTSFEEMVTAAKAGKTIIDGGYIRTDLINVATLIAKRLSTTDENSLKSLTIQDNQIKLYDANGALRTHIHANALSTPATNTQEVFTPGLVNFTGLNMLDGVIAGSASLFNFVAGSGNDTIQGSNTIAVNFNLRLNLSQKSFADFDIDIAAKLKINGTVWQSSTLGFSIIAEGSFAIIQQTLYLDPTTARALSSAGAKEVTVEFTVEPQHGLAAITNSVYGSVSFSSADYTVTHVSSTPQITEVGIDGIQVMRSGSEYAQIHESNGHLEFKILTGSYGLRVNSGGVQKTTNGGSSWTSL